MYCVIVGEIVNSRLFSPHTREQVIHTAKNVFNRLNTDYSDTLVINFAMVRGDTFEGVLLAPCHAPHIVLDLIKAFYNVEKTLISISVAIGQLSINGSGRNDTDGPAFHQAMDGLTKLRVRKGRHWLQVAFDCGQTAQPLFDSQFSLLSALTEGWTDKQREIAWAMDAHEGRQKTVTEQLAISPSVVSKQLKAASYHIYRQAWDNLEQYLILLEEEALTDKPAKKLSFAPFFAAALRRIALGQNELNNNNDTLMLLQKSLELAKKELGEDNHLLAQIYTNIADIYCSIKRNQEAEAAIQESLRLQRALPRARLQYVETILIKARICREKGTLKEAQEFFDEAITIAEDTLETGHPFFGRAKNDLAILLLYLGEHNKALQYFEESLTVIKDKAKKDPINYGITVKNIAVCHYKAKNYKDALPYAQEALEVLEKNLPADHESISTTRKLLSFLRIHMTSLPTHGK